LNDIGLNVEIVVLLDPESSLAVAVSIGVESGVAILNLR
jgi:hypothetical protein